MFLILAVAVARVLIEGAIGRPLAAEGSDKTTASFKKSILLYMLLLAMIASDWPKWCRTNMGVLATYHVSLQRLRPCSYFAHDLNEQRQHRRIFCHISMGLEAQQTEASRSENS